MTIDFIIKIRDSTIFPYLMMTIKLIMELTLTPPIYMSYLR